MARWLLELIDSRLDAPLLPHATTTFDEPALIMTATAIVLSPVTSPGDYHRIVSPTLVIPTNLSRSLIMSTSVRCYNIIQNRTYVLRETLGNPLLHRLNTFVVDAFPLQADAPQKLPRKGAKVPRSDGVVLQVILHDTIIFPEGGGQPSDIGYISVGSGTTLEVFEAKRVGGHAVHYVRFPTLDELQETRHLLPASANVVVTLGDNGYRRRLDHVSVSIRRLSRFLPSLLS